MQECQKEAGDSGDGGFTRDAPPGHTSPVVPGAVSHLGSRCIADCWGREEVGGTGVFALLLSSS